MKAFVLPTYGSPEVLRLADVDTPVPAEGEVLIRVRATSVNPYDWHTMRGEPRIARLMGVMGLRRPPLEILGCDIAGEVAAVGPGVSGFAAGDPVYALAVGGGFGEYAAVPAERVAAKPPSLTYEQAAAIPMAGVTALLAVRENGGVRAGQRVLVVGGSGGVGTFAVQLAAASGAHVTAVCGPANVDLVRSLGAAEVIDYTAADFTRERGYDVLIDISGAAPVRAARRTLTREGVYVAVGGKAGRWFQPAGHVLGAMLLGLVVPQRFARADAVAGTDKGRQLRALAELVDAGSLTPVVARTYPFAELPTAVAYQEAGHAPGKVVVTVS
jgi:NADPH:quinone reductase-like Zn-dependent oxidoreductase